MKLLVFSPAYPPRRGGLESHAADFNYHLARSSKITWIRVFTPLVGDAKAVEQVGKKITVYRFPVVQIIPNFLFPKVWSLFFWQQWRAIAKDPADIVISRTRFFLTSPLAWCYARRFKKKYVHIEHGSDFPQLNSRFSSVCARIYDYTLGAFVLRYSDVTVAISQAVEQFCRRFNPRTMPIIYRGVEIEKIEKVAAFPRDEKYAVVAYCGRLIDGKGVNDLIVALSNLHDKTTRLWIIGDGPQRDAWVRMVNDYGLNSRVVFWGEKPQYEAIALLKAADICVNPSYTEGLPTSVLESALCRKAIIATDVGGTKEIIQDQITGLLVPPRNPEVLTQALDSLIGDADLRNTYGRRAHDDVASRFSWHQATDRYIALFSELLT